MSKRITYCETPKKLENLTQVVLDFKKKINRLSDNIYFFGSLLLFKCKFR